MRQRHAETPTAETVAHVREVMGRGNPVGEAEQVGTADDAEGRRALARILATGRDAPATTERPPRRRRRRWTIILAATVSIGALGAGADAAGIIPTGVTKAFEQGNDSDSVWGDVVTSKARMLIRAQAPEGGTAELWTAPGTKGGECRYLRRLEPGKDAEDAEDAEDGSLECSDKVSFPGTGALGGLYGALVGDWMGVYGRAAPPATTIRVTLQDGRRHLVPVRAGGYFMAVLDHKQGPPKTKRPTNPEDPYEGFAPADLAALDAKGRVIATLRTYESSL
ncbi:hypothetical protein SMC26_44025 [Actinomadura fulvescens]|uniref:Uncharacterized protein n=1 Tax=Actinomadura fulvescens TaxID=46160 RepID=A0ABP6BYJ1_9ACTN